jgi:hypothetical protein
MLGIEKQLSTTVGQTTAYTVAIPAGAAGVEVTFKLPHSNILNAKGDKLGFPTDTSVAFTGTAMLAEKKEADYKALSNDGDYWIDYNSGLVTLQKADSTTSATVDYKFPILNIQ